MRKLFWGGAILVGMLFVTLCPVRAQEFSGVNGVVSDKTGGALAGVTVALDNTKTGAHASTVTNDQGYFQILHVNPADGYQLTFTKDGFRKLIVTNVSLGVSSTETRNAILELGNVAQTVEVHASGEGSLNTTDASIGNVIDAKAIDDLPIQFRLDAANLMQLQAGVNDAGSITGARSDQGNITLDGLDINDQATGQAFTSTIPVSVDALQEVRTITAGETADFGRSSGGMIVLETKGGTNDWHGNLREYNRNTLFEANDWFNNRDGVGRAPLIRNQFGGNLGGPIKKDKLFFFFDVEAVRVSQGSQIEQSVPLPTLLAGQIGYVNNTTNPATGSMCDGTARLSNAPTCISYASAAQVATLDPQGVGADPAITSLLASRYPAPNDPTGGDGINTEGFRFNAPAHESDNVYTGRVDYTLSNKHKIFLSAKIAREGVDDFFNTTIEQFPGDPHPTNRDEFNGYSLGLGWTWSVTSNLLNQFSGGLTRAILEFPSITQPTYPNLFSFSPNIASPYHGFATQSRDVPVPEFRDGAIWTKGKHTIDVGTDIKLIRQISALKNDFNFISIGLGGFTDSLEPSLRPVDISSDPSAITDWDNFFPFLLGRYAETSTNFNYDKSGTALAAGSGKSRDFNYNEFEFYAQDTWKLRSDLTVTYGLRYDLHTVPYETNGFESTPSVNENVYLADRVNAAAQGISGLGAVPLVSYSLGGAANNAPGYYKPDHKDFGPRIGFAYNPSFQDGLLKSIFGDRKTTVRLGASILYDRIGGGASFGLDQNTFLFDSSANLPFGNSLDPTAALLNDPRFTGFNNLPGSLFPTAPSVKAPSTPNVDSTGFPFGLANGGFPAFFQFDQNTKNPYAIVLNYGIQRELPGNFLLEVSYVGRLGRRLLAVGDAATVTNFKDPTSGQLLRTAFGTLEKQVQTGQPVTDEPWFENQINSALQNDFGPGVTCNNGFGISCTQLVAGALTNFVQKGDLSSIILELAANSFPLLNLNVGLPAQTGANGYIGNYASSNYNAMLVTLRKRVSNGLQFDFNYTLSHSIDNVSAVVNNYVQYTAFGTGLVCDLTDPRACRASSDFDARNVFNTHFVYDLPFGRGHHFLHDSPRWVDAVLGGWTTSGIITWRSGYPFTSNTGAFPTAFTLDAPALLVGPRSALKPGIHTDAGGNLQYFANVNTALSALGFDENGQVGNRNVFNGPSFSNVDLGLAKSFKMPWSERQQLKLRWDAFNALNHPSFNPPGSNSLSNLGDFGLISSTASTPRVMQVALRFEF